MRISGIRRTDDIDLLDDGVGGDEFNFSGLHAGKPAVVKAEVDDDGVDVVGEGEDPPVEIAVLLGEGPGQPEDDFEDPPSSDDDDDIHVPVCLDDPEQDDRDLAAGLFRIAPRDCHVKHEWDDTAGAMQWTNRADGTPLGRSSFMGDSCILVKCCVHDHVRCGRRCVRKGPAASAGRHLPRAMPSARSARTPRPTSEGSVPAAVLPGTELRPE